MSLGALAARPSNRAPAVSYEEEVYEIDSKHADLGGEFFELPAFDLNTDLIRVNRWVLLLKLFVFLPFVGKLSGDLNNILNFRGSGNVPPGYLGDEHLGVLKLLHQVFADSAVGLFSPYAFYEMGCEFDLGVVDASLPFCNDDDRGEGRYQCGYCPKAEILSQIHGCGHHGVGGRPVGVLYQLLPGVVQLDADAGSCSSTGEAADDPAQPLVLPVALGDGDAPPRQAGALVPAAAVGAEFRLLAASLEGLEEPRV